MRSGLDEYRASFRARCLAARDGATHALVESPGLVGMTALATGGRTLLLATDDRALDALQARLPALAETVIRLGPAATGCAELLRSWTTSCSIAMLHPALEALRPVATPSGFAVREVARDDDEGSGPTLRDALRVALLADPSIAQMGSEASVLAQLRAMPASYRFHAAVDADGAIAATAAGGRFGRHAAVSFVTTLPARRGRGLATALTAHALVEVRAEGSTSACLEASEAGRSIYRRLGFVELFGVRICIGPPRASDDEPRPPGSGAAAR